jgi:hypothetical protein
MAKKPTMWTYRVQGRGVFPMDMLRYDAAYPKTERDSNLIIRLLASSEDRVRKEPWSVRLYGHTEPTARRWESFGWQVFEVEPRP